MKDPEAWPFSDDEMYALVESQASTDAAKIAHLEDLLDDREAAIRARERAVEIVTTAAADGSLDLLAGHLSRSSPLSGDDVAQILRSCRPDSAGGSVDPHRKDPQ